MSPEFWQSSVCSIKCTCTQAHTQIQPLSLSAPFPRPHPRGTDYRISSRATLGVLVFLYQVHTTYVYAYYINWIVCELPDLLAEGPHPHPLGIREISVGWERSSQERIMSIFKVYIPRWSLVLLTSGPSVERSLVAIDLSQSQEKWRVAWHDSLWNYRFSSTAILGFKEWHTCTFRSLNRQFLPVLSYWKGITLAMDGTPAEQCGFLFISVQFLGCCLWTVLQPLFPAGTEKYTQQYIFF